MLLRQRALPSCCFLAFAFMMLQAARGQDADWTALPRESSPSLEIRWHKGEARGEWKSGPAEITRDDTVTLHVEAAAGASVRWYQIVPDTRKFYKNANFPWEPDAYKWVGYGKVECQRREMTAWRGRSEVALRPLNTSKPADQRELAFADAGRFYHHDLGSFWFDVEVQRGGKLLRSPGLQDGTERGMSTRVFRLSIRIDDSLLGCLTSFFNVPGIFGCTPYQSSNYIGVDCADCLAAAWSKWKRQPLSKDWNVEGIVAAWPKVREFDITGGSPASEIKWGSDVKPGDFIAVRYAGRRQYQHIGALYSDADKDGKLGPTDLVIHAGPEALQLSLLSRGNFDGHVAIIRAVER